MAIVELSDGLQGTAASRSYAGTSVSREFLVNGFSTSGSGQVLEALTATNLPQIGDAHPDDASIVCLDQQAKMTGRDRARVVCKYGRNSGDKQVGGSGQARFSMDTYNEETVYDRTGALMHTTYTGSASVGIFSVEKVHRVEVMRPTVTCTLTRLEASLPGAAVYGAFAKVNSVSWSGYPAKTWLMRGFSADQEESGNWRVSYGFSYRESTWRAMVNMDVYGVIPNDASEANEGVAFFDVYDELDFNSVLGVSF